MAAASDGSKEVVNNLVEGGADIGLRDLMQFTALDHAKKNNHLE